MDFNDNNLENNEKINLKVHLNANQNSKNSVKDNFLITLDSLRSNEDFFVDTNEFEGKKLGKTPRKSKILGNDKKNFIDCTEKIKEEEEQISQNNAINEINLKLSHEGISKFQTIDKIDEIICFSNKTSISPINAKSKSKNEDEFNFNFLPNISFKRGRIMGKGPNGKIYECLDLLTGEILAIKNVVKFRFFLNFFSKAYQIFFNFFIIRYLKNLIFF